MRANLSDRHLYAALIAASLVVALTLAPALASAVSSIVSANISTSPNKLNANIVTASKVATGGSDGAFGYAVLTGGNSLMVATTHGGICDSSTQSAIDTIHVDSSCSPVWHTHYVQLIGAGSYCASDNGAANLPALEVKNLSYQTPGNLQLFNNQVHFKSMPSTFTGTDAASGNSMTWSPGVSASAVASFTLTPVFDITTGDLTHVCVDNISPVAAGS
jgi:hypothetical protein